MQRIDKLTSAPVVGQFYLVPTVEGEWDRINDAWPVIGPKHTDLQFFDFEAEHYHIDGRFLTKRQRERCEGSYWYGGLAAAIQAMPLHQNLGKPVLARRRCWTSNLDYVHALKPPIQKLAEHYAGHQCAKGKAGWICPHQKASLGSIEIIDGVITCPLHGLRINAATGLALSQHQS